MTPQSGAIRKEGSKYYILDPKSGRELLLRGYGSLKGKLEIGGDIDWTKPVFEQVRKARTRRKGAAKTSAAAD